MIITLIVKGLGAFRSPNAVNNLFSAPSDETSCFLRETSYTHNKVPLPFRGINVEQPFTDASSFQARNQSLALAIDIEQFMFTLYTDYGTDT